MSAGTAPGGASALAGFLSRHPEFQLVHDSAGEPEFIMAAAGNLALDADRLRARLFEGLSVPILHQQLSGTVARVLEARLGEACGGELSPQKLLSLGADRMRALGLSASKARALLGLSEEVASGKLELESLLEMDDEAVTARLCELWGLGPWSAHMFLLFTLGRMDVWAPADLGVRKGYAKLYELEDLPSARELALQKERYSPSASIATWYLWRVLEL
ncbi:MAG: DNA-3-methyladenine glycosylase 2 family protein [Actinomycetota bacterium]|nr:DNA-3-methyladenine glycosylase 2 family protein [Actinomycetota bacterium]